MCAKNFVQTENKITLCAFKWAVVACGVGERHEERRRRENMKEGRESVEGVQCVATKWRVVTAFLPYVNHAAFYYFIFEFRS